MHSKKKEIEKFLLNIYRRDKHIFFPSSVGNVGSVVLAIMPNLNQSEIAINKQEIFRWQSILKAKVYHLKNISELNELVQNWQFNIIYVVAPLVMRQQLQNLYGSQENVKRILYGTLK